MLGASIGQVVGTLIGYLAKRRSLLGKSPPLNATNGCDDILLAGCYRSVAVAVTISSHWPRVGGWVVTTTYTTLLNWLDVIINVNKIYEAVHQELSGDFACLSVLRSLLTDSDVESVRRGGEMR